MRQQTVCFQSWRGIGDSRNARGGRAADVTALHNHALMDVPRLFYMHFWATDDAAKLARGLKAALDLTNSQK
jgi:uncharacterized protein DUF1259